MRDRWYRGLGRVSRGHWMPPRSISKLALPTSRKQLFPKRRCLRKLINNVRWTKLKALKHKHFNAIWLCSSARFLSKYAQKPCTWFDDILKKHHRIRTFITFCLLKCLISSILTLEPKQIFSVPINNSLQRIVQQALNRYFITFSKKQKLWFCKFNFFLRFYSLFLDKD